MSVTSWVDGVLAQIENHEATVAAAIGRVRQSAARARAQLKRVERDRQRLVASLAKETEAAAAWRQRAQGADDDERALECLRRHKAATQRAEALRDRLREHEIAHKELTRGIAALDARLGELTERKNLMRTRQSRAEAVHGMAHASGPLGDIDDVFERWESRVGEIEIASDCDDALDTFEESFATAEEREALRIELEELRNDASREKS